MAADSKSITLADARKLAEDAVRRDKPNYETQEFIHALEEEVLEAEHCWIFQRSKRIRVLPTSWFTKSYDGFAVSKKGALSQITTFEGDRAKLLDYLQVMSEYFGRRGE